MALHARLGTKTEKENPICKKIFSSLNGTKILIILPCIHSLLGDEMPKIFLYEVLAQRKLFILFKPMTYTIHTLPLDGGFLEIPEW